MATSEMFNAFRLSENNKLSSEQMKSFNPSIMNIVIRKYEANINSVLLSEKTVLTVESNNVSSLSNTSESTFALKQSPILMANASWESRTPLRKAGSSSYWGMSANEIYNYYVLKSNDESDLFANDNILYIGQYMSDDQGHLITEYDYFNGYHYYGGDSDGNSWSYDRERFSGTPEDLLKAMSKTNLSSAQVTVPDILCNGAEQFAEPEVTLNGETLTEGIDYDIEKRYSAIYPGEYELIITGIRHYTGEVSATYKIYCNHNFANNKCTICKSLKDTVGDANGDGVVGIADLVALQDFLIVRRKDISINADVNQDGVINVFDMCLLRRIVSDALS